MKAIVEIESNPQRTVHLLGYGDTEREARVAAFAYLNRGFNDFEREYGGGRLVDVGSRLEQVILANDRTIYTLDEAGHVVGADSAFPAIESVLNTLCIRDGVLRTYSIAAGDL